MTTVTLADTPLNNEKVQQSSQENFDSTDQLLPEPPASNIACLEEKLAKATAQVTAVLQLENAISSLEACADGHRAIVMSVLPVGPILETKHEKLKKAGVSLFSKHTYQFFIQNVFCS